ncbi:MAG: DMT family transporter [Bacteroidales bacterium]|nr:DMT family transporter [Bacteroidales bacterium]
MKASNLIKIYGGLLLAMIFWGMSFIGTKYSLNTLNPISIVLIRLIISCSFLIVLGKMLKVLKPIKRNHIHWFIILAFFEPFLYFIGETYGLKYISPTIGSILISTIPLFVPWGAWLFFKEKINIKNFIGIVISVVGVFFTMLNKNFEFTASLLGVSLVLVAVISAIAYTLIIRHIAHDYSALSIITYQNLLGIPFFVPLFFFIDFPTFNIDNIHPLLWLVLLLLGIFPSSFSYMFYTYAVREIGVSRTSVFTNLIPIITAIASYLLFNETLTFVKIIGIVIVIIGLYIAQKAQKT